MIEPMCREGQRGDVMVWGNRQVAETWRRAAERRSLVHDLRVNWRPRPRSIRATAVFVRRDERDRLAGAAHAAGAAHSVREQLLGVRQVVIDHLCDALNVQASRGHVGGNQNWRDPERKSCITRSRATWLRLPWRAPTG